MKNPAKNSTPAVPQEITEQLLQEVILLKQLLHAHSTSVFLKRLLVKTNGKLIVVQTQDIDWIEAWGDYVRLHCNEKTYIVRQKISELEAQLSPEAFIRIGRSAIVNIDQILEFEPLHHGDYLVTLRNASQLNVSRNYRDRLGKVFGIPG